MCVCVCACPPSCIQMYGTRVHTSVYIGVVLSYVVSSTCVVIELLGRCTIVLSSIEMDRVRLCVCIIVVAVIVVVMYVHSA